MKKTLLSILCVIPLLAHAGAKEVVVKNETKKSMVYVVKAPSGKSAAVHTDVRAGEERAIPYKKIEKEFNGHWRKRDWFEVQGNKYGFGPAYTSVCYLKKDVLQSSSPMELRFVHKTGPLGGHGTCLCPKDHMNVTCFKDLQCMNAGAEHKMKKCGKNINPEEA